MLYTRLCDYAIFYYHLYKMTNSESERCVIIIKTALMASILDEKHVLSGALIPLTANFATFSFNFYSLLLSYGEIRILISRSRRFLEMAMF